MSDPSVSPVHPAPLPAAGLGVAADGGPALVPMGQYAAATPPVPPAGFAARRSDALRRIALEQAAPVATALSVALAVLALAHLVLVAPEHRVALSVVAASSATITGAVRLWIARRPAQLLAQAHAILGLLLGVALVNSAHHVIRTGELWQSTNLMLVLLGAAALTFSWRVVILLWGLAWAAFALTLMVWAPPTAEATHWSIALGMSNVVAVVSVRARRRQIDRLLQAELEANLGRAAAEALAADLDAARQRAVELASQRDGLIGTLSHELRSPLQGVLGAAELLGPVAQTQAQRQAVQTVATSGAMMLHVVNQVLEHGRAAHEPVELGSEPFHLSEVIDEVFGVLAARAAAQRTPLSWRPPAGGLPMLRGDRGRVRQILLNLVSNAVKFTAGGLVRVEVDAPDPAGLVELRVIDTGVGFDPAVAERIFEPYRQAGPEVARRFGGTGLGLSISRAFARRMGGDLVAQGAPGAGACFTLRLALPACGPAPRPLTGLPLAVVGDGPLHVDLVARLGALGAALTGPQAARRHFLLRGPLGATRLLALGADGAHTLQPPWSDGELCRAARRGRSALAAAPLVRAPQLGVLLVDDTPSAVLPLQLALEAAGHAVTVVSSAEGALAAMRGADALGAHPALVITDLHLGGMSGEALARALRLRGSAPRVWVLTGDRLPADALATAGVERVLHKPVSPTALALEVSALAAALVQPGAA
ncbi:MAG: response regulator [Deltaproteobacteria bacterium]|nr:response regulator [Deltaproteobacteria bacterium]